MCKVFLKKISNDYLQNKVIIQILFLAICSPCFPIFPTNGMEPVYPVYINGKQVYYKVDQV